MGGNAGRNADYSKCLFKWGKIAVPCRHMWSDFINLSPGGWLDHQGMLPYGGLSVSLCCGQVQYTALIVAVAVTI